MPLMSACTSDFEYDLQAPVKLLCILYKWANRKSTRDVALHKREDVRLCNSPLHSLHGSLTKDRHWPWGIFGTITFLLFEYILLNNLPTNCPSLRSTFPDHLRILIKQSTILRREPLSRLPKKHALFISNKELFTRFVSRLFHEYTRRTSSKMHF